MTFFAFTLQGLSVMPAVVGVVLAGLLGALLAGGALAVFGTAPAPTQSDIIRQLVGWRVLDAAGGLLRNIVAKTADYTIVSPFAASDGTGDPSGTIFTNRGASGAVVFTLPAVTLAMKGMFYEFLGVADQNFTVATATADTLLVVNDAAADSLAVSTSSHKIGAHMRFICDGVAWAGYGDSVGDTFTVAT